MTRTATPTLRAAAPEQAASTDALPGDQRWHSRIDPHTHWPTEPLAVLHAELDGELAAHSAEYNQGLANHLPMLRHAQFALGATAAERAALATSYLPRLEPLGPAEAAAVAQWQARLREQGRAALLAAEMPQLMRGCGAGAFHGLLRAGHALASGHDGELARALAYWQAAHLPLRPPAASWPAGRLDALAWAKGMLALPRPEHADVERPRITLRMAAWATAPGFDAAATALRVDDAPQTLQALARLAARLYAASGNFTVLHALTSSWALALLLPHAVDARQAVREYALALAAALRAARLTALPAPDEPPEPLPWTQLARAACASHDDHLPKLVYTCRAWQQRLGEPVFAAAASRAVRAGV